MRTYKALYEDENVMEIFIAKNDAEAIEDALSYESEHGNLWNVFLLDENYSEIDTIF
jgi:hypothetical protein